MLSCPACHEAGIFEHSVRVDANQVRRAGARGESPVMYSSCARCQAWFRRDLEGGFVREPGAAGARDANVWIVPLWKESSDAASFQLSWDVTEAFFERMAADHAIDVEPLRALIAPLRGRGFDARLRAGQSLSSLVLSRARAHGLEPGHAHLVFQSAPNGTLRVDGTIRGAAVKLGPIAPDFAGGLREHIEALASVPIE